MYLWSFRRVKVTDVCLKKEIHGFYASHIQLTELVSAHHLIGDFIKRCSNETKQIFFYPGRSLP